MQLVADRFALEDGDAGRAVDLASGTTVTLIVSSAGGVSEQMRWTLRCDGLQKLHHRTMASLADFGIVGDSSRFEAWRCGRPWHGSPATARSQYDIGSRFLRASGLSVEADAAAHMHIGYDGAVLWLPGPGCGYPQEEAPSTEDEVPLNLRGLSFIDRPAVAALAEMFHGGPRPNVAALWGPRGSGKTWVVRELARLARLNGFVPVTSRLINSRYAALWRGRSVFVINEGEIDGIRDESAAWTALLQTALRSSQPHAMLLVGADERRSVDGVGLDRVRADALVAALRPCALSERLERAARRAAERSRGLPGRFARLLSIEGAAASRAMAPARNARLSRVAEQPAVYGAGEEALSVPVVGDPFTTPPAQHTWPAPGELSALRRRLDGAIAQLAAGRHAPGIRHLRQAVGGLARRDVWTDAASGALVLVSSLLQRGRVRESQAAMDEAREYASRAGRDALLLDIATLSGEAWIDLAALDEAESVLGAALASARAARDVARTAAASVALARCLFWRGRYADAEVALGVEPADAATATRVRHRLLAARVAVGRRDVGRAMALATEACQQGRDEGNQRSVAAAACTTAFVHLAVGDYDAVARDVAESMTAARAAHDPLRAIRARLILAEADRRRGRSASFTAHLRRLERVVPTLPAVLRAHWDLLKALTPNGTPDPEVAARHAAATGLAALTLYAGDERVRMKEAEASDPMVDEMVAILRLCQTAEDEARVLKEVCVRVRQQLHAAAVAFVAVAAGGGQRPEILVADGGRLDVAVAERAMLAGATITPHRHEDRIDAATPVQYGGVPLGALCARWPIGSPYDLSRAGVVLTMSAAAAAPILSAALAKGERAAKSAPGDLLGVTPAMDELRRSAERAAAAPFAVLIDGESGSGKELVARAVHRGGPRRDRPFCTLNCAAIPDDLVEAELFGHARGAFTGAVADRAGVFEEAHGGTLFLDEVGELSPRAQAKILRVIQEGELRRVGENVSRRVDVRIVAATNRHLRQEVDAGRFRLDLLYRLDVIRITVPALRDRREDIAVLAEHFWRDSTARVGSRATLAAATLAALGRYDWPGNVRELQNVLAALTVRSPKRGVVPPTALPPTFTQSPTGDAWRLHDARRTFEERFVRAALARSGGHRARAAAELGVTRQGLTKLMTRLGISA